MLFIQNCLDYHSNIFKHPSDVVHHMFAVLGNGIKLNLKGYIPDNYQSDKIFQFPNPIGFKWMYPYDDDKNFQPFRKLSGCRDVGFKEAAEYFIKCIELTDYAVDNAKDWKDNLNYIKEVLLNTPSIKDEYIDVETGMYKFINKLKNCNITSQHPKDGTILRENNSVKKVWFFDVQWSDCPQFVENEVRDMWSNYELGNDNYIIKTCVDEELFNDYPNVYFWLRHKGVVENENVIIHWWW